VVEAEADVEEGGIVEAYRRVCVTLWQRERLAIPTMPIAVYSAVGRVYYDDTGARALQPSCQPSVDLTA